MEVVAEANTYFDEDPDRYYREIDGALSELVDWRGFATAVMGEYYSRGRAMDKAGRANLKRRRDDFAVTLREGLIRSYAKGLLAFGGARMEVQGVEASPQSTRIASVTQLVYGEAERVYTIRYQMEVYLIQNLFNSSAHFSLLCPPPRVSEPPHLSRGTIADEKCSCAELLSAVPS